MKTKALTEGRAWNKMKKAQTRITRRKEEEADVPSDLALGFFPLFASIYMSLPLLRNGFDAYSEPTPRYSYDVFSNFPPDSTAGETFN